VSSPFRLWSQSIKHAFPNRSNFGQGRYIPFHEDEIKVHISVKLRMDDPKQKYIPAAYNWDVALKSGMLTWVGKEEDERDEKGRTDRMVDANS